MKTIVNKKNNTTICNNEHESWEKLKSKVTVSNPKIDQCSLTLMINCPLQSNIWLFLFILLKLSIMYSRKVLEYK